MDYPSGIVAAYYLAKAGLKVAQFDRKLAPGGGMWGGAMMFNQIVIQEEATDIVKEFNINHDVLALCYAKFGNAVVQLLLFDGVEALPAVVEGPVGII